MRRSAAAMGSAAFFLAAPSVVAGAVPWWLTGWRSVGAGSVPLSAVGAAGVVVGVGLLADSFVRFVADGRGTPAPVAPTEELVVTGPYRWVRNPMYLGVELVILGQAALLRQPVLLAYGVVVGVVVASFVHLYEEPTLRASHGSAYDAYRDAVPAWVPRPPRGGHR